MKHLFTLMVSIVLHFYFIHAQTIYVDADASGANNGSSWADAYTDLQDALDNANTDDAIWIAEGTYFPGSGSLDTNSVFNIETPVKLYGGFDGTEAMLEDRDFDNNITRLSGDLQEDDIPGNLSTNREDNATHVVVVDSLLSSSTVFDGLYVSGGHTSNNGDLELFARAGGGIFSRSTIEVRNCVFEENYGRSGAGIYVIWEDLEGCVFENSLFEDNQSTSQGAGIMLNTIVDAQVINCDFENNIAVRGAFYPLRCENILVDGCNFINNENSGGFGGALFSWSNEFILVKNSTFEGNVAGNSGAGYIDGRELDDGLISFDSCTFRENEVSGWGGALGILQTPNSSITNCTFEGNIGAGLGSTSGGGGALWYGFVGENEVSNCLFESNTSEWGGAIFVQNDSTNLYLEECDFLFNSCNGNGGAVYTSGGSILEVDDCYFELNSGEFGGAITCLEDSLDLTMVAIENSIFNFNNASEQGGAFNFLDSDVSIVNCLIANNTAQGNGTGGALSNNATFQSNAVVNLMNTTFAKNFGNGDVGGSIAQWEESDTMSTDAIINAQNCIFNDFDDNYRIEDGTPIFNSNGGNLSNDDSMESFLTGTNDLNDEDPEFVDEDDDDYHLSPGSPCINMGIATDAPPFDIEGTPRYGEVDMGAYEYIDPTNVAEADPNINGIDLFPNPAKAYTNLQLNNDWEGELQVHIFDVTGKLVISKTFEKMNNSQSFELRLDNLQRGFYEAYIIFNKEQFSSKLIKL